MLYGLSIFRSNQTLEKVFTATHANIESARAFAVQRIGLQTAQFCLPATHAILQTHTYLAIITADLSQFVTNWAFMV